MQFHDHQFIIRFHRKWIWRCLVMFILVFHTGSVMAQVGHRYPRIGIFYWGGAHAAHYRNYDLVQFNMTNGDFAREIKSYNPDIILLPTTDWNAGGAISPMPDEWVPVNSQGDKLYYREYDQADFTNYCLEYNGKKFNEYLPEFLTNRIDLSVFDGIATDGVWDIPRDRVGKVTDIDLDRNGINDLDEYGMDWVESQFVTGIRKIVQGLRDRMDADKLVLLNSGQFHMWAWSSANGIVLEYCGDPINFDWFKRHYDEWMNTAPEPHIMLYDGRANYSRYQPTPSRNHFRLMRFQLTTALLGDAYWSFTDIESRDHNYIKYYDEYDLDLGYPTGIAQVLGNGCWIRFFDLGCSIVNPTASTKTVTNANLQSMPGYAGPYYRFLGGQQPEYNNGQQFDSISLFGERDGLNNNIYGDGIVLLTEPMDLICEIIIDDVHPGTNPGSYPAVLEGEWIHDSGSGGGYYCLADRPWKAYWRYAYTRPGSGEKRAIYTPNIGIAGFYEVFEWHGYLGVNSLDVLEADNLPYTLTYSRGVSASGTIDQSVNYGQWNSLGTYWFDEGSNGNVTITNDANGYLIADVFKFVYSGREPDEVLPEEPGELRSSSQTGTSITLSWEPSLPAIDGDTAAAYQVFRNSTFVGSPISTQFIDEGLSESTTYDYMIYAVDKAANRSTVATTGSFPTSVDIQPPYLVAVNLVSLSTLEVIFSEPLEEASAENITNYSIENNISIFAATLQADMRTVRLTTSTHVIGAPYSIIVNNVGDRALIPNTIAQNSTLPYIGSGGTILISVACDDGYELYINDVLVGEGSVWNSAQTYTVSSVAGKNVIALKCTDRGGEAGLVSEIDFNGNNYVTNEEWKVSIVEETGWKGVDFVDIGWQKATSYGYHGVSLPWAQYQDVDGISTDSNVEWIWSSDNEEDDVIYIRYTLGTGGDVTPPNPPTGVTVTQQ